jgi:PhnB protein
MAIKKTTRKKTKLKKFDAVPAGFHTVTPYLAVKGAAQALEWYKKAFGAKELDREEVEGGMLMHARMRIGNSIIMMSDIFLGALHKSPLDLGAASVTLHVYTKNVDELWKRAVEAGANVNMQLEDMFWGDRYGQLTDPFGHSWSLSKRIPMSKKEMDRKRQEAMKMFKQDQPPGYQEQQQ